MSQPACCICCTVAAPARSRDASHLQASSSYIHAHDARRHGEDFHPQIITIRTSNPGFCRQYQSAIMQASNHLVLLVLTSWLRPCQRTRIRWIQRQRPSRQPMTNTIFTLSYLRWQPRRTVKVAARAIGNNCTSLLMGRRHLVAAVERYASCRALFIARPTSGPPSLHAVHCYAGADGGCSTRVFSKGSLCSRDERRNNGSRVQRSLGCTTGWREGIHQPPHYKWYCLRVGLGLAPYAALSTDSRRVRAKRKTKFWPDSHVLAPLSRSD